MDQPETDRKPLPMAAFALAALLPVPLLLAGVWAGGGPLLWAGFLYMAALSVLLDQMIPHVAGDAPEGAEFPAADAVLLMLGVAALVLLPVAVWAVAGPSGLTTGQKLLVLAGAGLWLGQVAHPVAHELIHRGNRLLFRLGQVVYAALLFGQHASAHRLVHHRHVGTAQDTNTPRGRESFYRFARRAWTGGWREGWRAETALRARSAKRARAPHPYAVYMGIGALALIAGWMLAGWAGILVWMVLAAHAQMQILVSDYVQHYGLQRVTLPDGRLEPVGPQHSWNTAHWFSSAMMLNAPRHSDHHVHPTRPYPALRLAAADTAPHLPWPLPVACTLALFPRLWRRAMARHLRPWEQAAAARSAGQPRHGGVTQP